MNFLKAQFSRIYTLYCVTVCLIPRRLNESEGLITKSEGTRNKKNLDVCKNYLAQNIDFIIRFNDINTLSIAY